MFSDIKNLSPFKDIKNQSYTRFLNKKMIFYKRLNQN